MRGNVQYKLAVKSGLNAIYMNEVYAACYFNTAKVGRNPELFMAYRVVSTPTVSGINFGDRGTDTVSGPINRVQITSEVWPVREL